MPGRKTHLAPVDDLMVGRRLQRMKQLSRGDQKAVLKFLYALLDRRERRSA